MSPRIIEADEIPEVMTWFTKQGFEREIPLAALPPRGVIVPGLACAWLYESDSALGWIGFPVVNPDAHRAKAFKALSDVIDEIIAISEADGIQVLVATFGHESLKKLAYLKNFIESDTNVSNLWRIV